MNAVEHEQQVRIALYSVAPDLEGEALDSNLRYRDQFEFDSMDFLHFVVALHKLTGVEIPEQDYPRLETLASAVAYLREKSNPSPPDPGRRAP